MHIYKKKFNLYICKKEKKVSEYNNYAYLQKKSLIYTSAKKVIEYNNYAYLQKKKFNVYPCMLQKTCILSCFVTVVSCEFMSYSLKPDISCVINCNT